jgi:hypothetical protein
MSQPKRAVLGSTGVFGKLASPVLSAVPEEKASRPDRSGRTSMPFWTTIAAHKQLRMMAAEMDGTQQELMTMALNDLFEKYGKPRIA